MNTVIVILVLMILLLVYLMFDTISYGVAMMKNFRKLYLPGTRRYSIPQFSQPSMVASYSQEIPLILIQTGSYPVSPEIRQTSLINRHINPEYEYRFYNDTTDRIDYIKRYEPDLLPTYESILPGAFKADLFRYLVLYHEGGVYLDDKSTIIEPLRTFIKKDMKYVAFLDVSKGACFNGFIAVAPKHPIMREMIDRIKRNVKTKNYGINALDPTGPQLLGRCLNKFLGRPELYEFEEKEYPKQVDLLGTFYILNKKYQSLNDRNGTPLIHRCFNGYYNFSKVFKKNYLVSWMMGSGVYK